MDAPARMVRLPNPWGLNALVEASVRFTGLRNNSSNIPMRLKAGNIAPRGLDQIAGIRNPVLHLWTNLRAAGNL